MLRTRVLTDPDAVSEMAAYVARLEPELAKLPRTENVPVEAVRRARREGSGAFPAPVLSPTAESFEAPRRDGGTIALRVLRPAAGEARGAYLHLHGGGWVLGTNDEQDPRLQALADATGLVAVSVEYRLAPEHPFPAGPDDAEDAALWLVREGAEALGVPATFAIGGESAGGHLSALTLQRLRDGHGLTSFVAMNLVFGAFDIAQTPSQRLWGERRLILSGPLLDFFGECALPGVDAVGRADGSISPLHGGLEGLPPALLSIGTQDALLDDSLLMAQALDAAGGDAELHVLPGAFHGYTAFRDLRMVQAAEAAEHAFLAERIAAAGR